MFRNFMKKIVTSMLILLCISTQLDARYWDENRSIDRVQSECFKDTAIKIKQSNNSVISPSDAVKNWIITLATPSHLAFNEEPPYSPGHAITSISTHKQWRIGINRPGRFLIKAIDSKAKPCGIFFINFAPEEDTLGKTYIRSYAGFFPYKPTAPLNEMYIITNGASIASRVGKKNTGSIVAFSSSEKDSSSGKFYSGHRIIGSINNQQLISGPPPTFQTLNRGQIEAGGVYGEILLYCYRIQETEPNQYLEFVPCTDVVTITDLNAVPGGPAPLSLLNPNPAVAYNVPPSIPTTDQTKVEICGGYFMEHPVCLDTGNLLTCTYLNSTPLLDRFSNNSTVNYDNQSLKSKSCDIPYVSGDTNPKGTEHNFCMCDDNVPKQCSDTNYTLRCPTGTCDKDPALQICFDKLDQAVQLDNPQGTCPVPIPCDPPVQCTEGTPPLTVNKVCVENGLVPACDFLTGKRKKCADDKDPICPITTCPAPTPPTTCESPNNTSQGMPPTCLACSSGGVTSPLDCAGSTFACENLIFGNFGESYCYTANTTTGLLNPPTQPTCPIGACGPVPMCSQITGTVTTPTGPQTQTITVPQVCPGGIAPTCNPQTMKYECQGCNLEGTTNLCQNMCPVITCPTVPPTGPTPNVCPADAPTLQPSCIGCSQNGIQVPLVCETGIFACNNQTNTSDCYNQDGTLTPNVAPTCPLTPCPTPPVCDPDPAIPGLATVKKVCSVSGDFPVCDPAAGGAYTCPNNTGPLICPIKPCDTPPVITTINPPLPPGVCEPRNPMPTSCYACISGTTAQQLQCATTQQIFACENKIDVASHCYTIGSNGDLTTSPASCPLCPPLTQCSTTTPTGTITSSPKCSDGTAPTCDSVSLDWICPLDNNKSPTCPIVPCDVPTTTTDPGVCAQNSAITPSCTACSIGTVVAPLICPTGIFACNNQTNTSSCYTDTGTLTGTAPVCPLKPCPSLPTCPVGAALCPDGSTPICNATTTISTYNCQPTCPAFDCCTGAVVQPIFSTPPTPPACLNCPDGNMRCRAANDAIVCATPGCSVQPRPADDTYDAPECLPGSPTPPPPNSLCTNRLMCGTPATPSMPICVSDGKPAICPSQCLDGRYFEFIPHPVTGQPDALIRVKTEELTDRTTKALLPLMASGFLHRLLMKDGTRRDIPSLSTVDPNEIAFKWHRTSLALQSLVRGKLRDISEWQTSTTTDGLKPLTKLMEIGPRKSLRFGKASFLVVGKTSGGTIIKRAKGISGGKVTGTIGGSFAASCASPDEPSNKCVLFLCRINDEVAPCGNLYSICEME